MRLAMRWCSLTEMLSLWRSGVDVAHGLRTERKGVPREGTLHRGMVAWLGFRQGPVRYQRVATAAGYTKYPLRKMSRFACRLSESSSAERESRGLAKRRVTHWELLRLHDRPHLEGHWPLLAFLDRYFRATAATKSSEMTWKKATLPSGLL